MAFVDVHMIPYMDDMHVPPNLTATSIVLLGVFEIGGSLVAGRLCDRGFLRGVLISGYVVRAGSLFLIAAYPSGPLVLLFGVLFGASYLVTVVATSMWVLRLFPIEIKGAVMGLMWTVHQIGAAFSSQFGAVSHDMTGSYVPEIIVIGAIAAAAAVLVTTLSSPPSPSSPKRDLVDTNA
jgi:predicted MFS family arabinose efflux permease